MIKRVVSLILCFVFWINIPVVLANEASSAAKIKPVEYTLPYPGMLPGNPFYFLKTFRDMLMGFFISDPLKKAEFELLQSDKSVATSSVLFDKGENERASQSLTESIITFEQSLQRTKEARDEGIRVDDFVATLTLANKKHEEVISDLLQTETGKKQKDVLTKTLAIIQKFDKKVKSILPQK